MATENNSGLSPQDTEELYCWIDGIPLSRPKRNISRDFSDGVLAAEIIHQYFPRLIDMHNYIPANGVNQKKSNWETLNRKVLSKLNCQISDTVIREMIFGKPGIIEKVLFNLKRKVEDIFITSPTRNVKVETEQKEELEDGYTQQKQDPNKRMSLLMKPNTYISISAKKGIAKEPMVPQVVLEEKQQELLLHKETIQVLQAKVERLEELLKLKDQRIEDLTQRFEQISANYRLGSKGILYTKQST